jgi:hypothetical protein
MSFFQTLEKIEIGKMKSLIMWHILEEKIIRNEILLSLNKNGPRIFRWPSSHYLHFSWWVTTPHSGSCSVEYYFIHRLWLYLLLEVRLHCGQLLDYNSKTKHMLLTYSWLVGFMDSVAINYPALGIFLSG